MNPGRKRSRQRDWLKDNPRGLEGMPSSLDFVQLRIHLLFLYGFVGVNTVTAVDTVKDCSLL